MEKCIWIVLGLCWSFSSKSQDIAFPLAASHPKTKVVEKVYKNILSITNNQQLGVLPTIQVVQRKQKIAAYAPTSNTIKIEEAAFDVCAQLGTHRDAALAILIAHEFIHFSKKHAGIRGFTCTYYEDTAELSYDNQEEEADFWGLFSTYLAGYDVLEVAPNLLATIYQQYGFTQQMQGYPPLQVRQQLGNRAIQKLTEYIQLYEAGNYLTAIGAYEQAASCYGTILEAYQSPELHNNLAVSLIRQALAIAPKGTYPYAYPIELAIDSRLYRHQKPPFGFDPQRLVKSYLQQAVNQLEAALRLHSKDHSALLNLAIAQEMLGQISLAKNTISSINTPSLNSIQRAHWSILKGIIAAKEQQVVKSKEFFQQAGRHAIAQLNQKIIAGESSPFTQQASPITASTIAIDGIGDLRRVNNYQQTIPLQTASNSDYYQPNYQFQFRLLPSSTIWKISRTRKLEQYSLQITSNPIAFTPEGIHMGSHLSELTATFGNPTNAVSTANGQFLFFPAKGLVFLMDERNTVRQWGKVMVVGGNF